MTSHILIIPKQGTDLDQASSHTSKGLFQPTQPKINNSIASKFRLLRILLRLHRQIKEFQPLSQEPEQSHSKAYRIFKYYQKIIYILLEQPKSSMMGCLIFGLLTTGILFTVGEAIFKAPESLLKASPTLLSFEAATLFCFTAELLLRLLSATAFENNVKKALLKFDLLADFVAIVPLVVQVLMSQNEASLIIKDLKIISLLKAFSVLKLLRYTNNMHILTKGLLQCVDSFAFLLFIIIISNLLFAMMVYYAEALNPKSRIRQGIPTAIWWSVVTMTTTGYGDIVPITPVGKVIGSIVGMFGMIVFALPVVVVGYHFQEVYNELEEEKFVKKLKENELKGKSTLNHDHRETFFLKKKN